MYKRQPQLCYAVLAPITLFAVLAPIDLPTAATLLACAPLIVLIVGMVAMRAARVFKKYWGKYTDMGAAFLDNLQGLETVSYTHLDVYKRQHHVGRQAARRHHPDLPGRHR